MCPKSQRWCIVNVRGGPSRRASLGLLRSGPTLTSYTTADDIPLPRPRRKGPAARPAPLCSKEECADCPPPAASPGRAGAVAWKRRGAVSLRAVCRMWWKMAMRCPPRQMLKSITLDPPAALDLIGRRVDNSKNAEVADGGPLPSTRES